MAWKSFAGGVAVGVVAAVVIAAVWPKPPWHALISMPDFEFINFDGDVGEQTFTAWGAIRGEHVAQTNNHVSILCNRAEGVCRSDSFDQIGENQVGRIDFTDYKVTEWTPGVIQAVDEELCAKVTMNISRGSQEVNFVREPSRVSEPVCAKADTSINKWELGRPLFWEKLNPKDDIHKGRWAGH